LVLELEEQHRATNGRAEDARDGLSAMNVMNRTQGMQNILMHAPSPRRIGRNVGSRECNSRLDFVCRLQMEELEDGKLRAKYIPSHKSIVKLKRRHAKRSKAAGTKKALH
jgi:hypothetical protein